jgi:hypothetical protein
VSFQVIHDFLTIGTTASPSVSLSPSIAPNQGQFIKIVLPEYEKTLTLVEFQVFNDADNNIVLEKLQLKVPPTTGVVMIVLLEWQVQDMQWDDSYL